MAIPMTLMRRSLGSLISAFAIGLALGFLAILINHQTDDHISSRPSEHIVFQAMAVSVIVGFWAPHALARRRMKAQQLQNDAEPLEDTLVHLRTVASTCMVASGLITLALPATGRYISQSHDILLHRFYWTTSTSWVLSVVLTLVLVAVPCCLMGAALNSLHRTVIAARGRPNAIIGLMCLGIGVSSWLGPALDLSRNIVLAVMAALPLLIVGLLGLPSLSRSHNPVPDELPTAPAFPSRWTFILPLVSCLCGFLIGQYVLALTYIINSSFPLVVSSLTVGLMCANGNRWRRFSEPRQIGCLCMLVAAVMVVIAMTLPAVLESHAWFIHWYSVPAVLGLGGVCVSVILVSTAERCDHSASAMQRSMISSAMGLLLSTMLPLIEVIGFEQAFQILVLLILGWLLVGGLLLIYDPAFHPNRQRPQLALMLTTLLVVCVKLPTQTGDWQHMLEKIRDNTHWSMTISDNSFQAQRMIANSLGQSANALAQHEPRLTSPAQAPLEAMVRLLGRDQEQHAAIILQAPTALEDSNTDQQELVVRIADALQPDGTLLVDLRSQHTLAKWEAWATSANGPFTTVRSHHTPTAHILVVCNDPSHTACAGVPQFKPLTGFD